MAILKSSGIAALQPSQAPGSITGKTQPASIELKPKGFALTNNVSGTLPLPIQSKGSTYFKFLALQNNTAKTTTATAKATALRALPLYAPRNEINPLLDGDGSQRQRGVQPEPRSNAPFSPSVRLASTQSVGAKQAWVVVEGVPEVHRQ